MGTRAAVYYKGKFMGATHWDGNPMSLGKGLLNSTRTQDAVLDIMADHEIDVIHKDFVHGRETHTIPTKRQWVGESFKEKETKGRKIHIFIPRDQKKAQALWDKYVKSATEKRGSFHPGEFTDVGNKIVYEAADIVASPSQYGDFAEWVYDVYPNKVLACPSPGEFHGKEHLNMRPVQSFIAKEEKESEAWHKKQMEEWRKSHPDEAKKAKARPKDLSKRARQKRLIKWVKNQKKKVKVKGHKRRGTSDVRVTKRDKAGRPVRGVYSKAGKKYHWSKSRDAKIKAKKTIKRTQDLWRGDFKGSKI